MSYFNYEQFYRVPYLLNKKGLGLRNTLLSICLSGALISGTPGDIKLKPYTQIYGPIILSIKCIYLKKDMAIYIETNVKIKINRIHPVDLELLNLAASIYR